MDNNTDTSDVVSQLIEQLKTTASIIDKKQKDSVRERLSTDDIESLIIDSSAKLIKGSVDAVDDLKQLVLTAPNAEDVEALSKLVAAAAAAIESLNKVYNTNRKVEAAKMLKQMDIDNRQKLQQVEIQGKLTINREELIKQMLNDAKTIDVTVTTVTQESA
jgi:hypothetical protein